MSTLAGSLVLFLVGTWSAYKIQTLWREAHPIKLYGCPLCPERVRNVSLHLQLAHAGSAFECQTCQRVVPVEHAEQHWWMWHAPRPQGPEDRPDWAVR